jgi:hypothetical protein
VKDNVLYIQEYISASTADRVRSLLTPEIGTVVLNSRGGDEAAAIGIGSLFAQHGQITALVRGQCLHACAQYMFVAAFRKTIMSNALVACGNNVIAASEITPLAKSRAFVRNSPTKVAALKLYERLDISLDYARSCTVGLGLICVDVRGSGDYTLDTVHSVWAPLEEDFARYGIGGVAGAPRTVAHARQISFLHRLNGDSDRFDRIAAVGSLKYLETCADLDAYGRGR